MEHVVGALTRRLAPGGALVLQVPSQLPPRRRIQSRRRAYATLRGSGSGTAVAGRLGLDPIRTTALSEERLAAAVESAGGTSSRADADDASGPHVPSRRYVVTRV